VAETRLNVHVDSAKNPAISLSRKKEEEIEESVEAAKKLFGFLSDDFDFDEMKMERLK